MTQLPVLPVNVADTLYKSIAAHVFAIDRKADVGTTAKNLYPSIPAVIIAALDLPKWYIKATSNPAQTTVSGWAAELSQSKRVAGILGAISGPLSAYSQLGARGISISFDGAGSVMVPRHAPGVIPNIFVGEGQPLPVISLPFSPGQALPYKAGFVTYLTGELSRYGIASVEQLLRQTMMIDAALSIDAALFSANAATSSAPAGILAGIAETPHSTTGGSAVENFAADLGNLSAGIPYPVDLVYVVSTSDYARALVYAGGDADGHLIASPAVPAKKMIALDAADFYAAENPENFDLAVSREATLVARTDPTEMVSAAGAKGTPTLSASQQDLVMIRLLSDVTFGMARASRVQWTSGVVW